MFGIGPAEMIILFVIALLGLAVPIGGIIAVVLVLRKNAAKTTTGKTLVPCPDCGRPLSPFAITCPQCGRPPRTSHTS